MYAKNIEELQAKKAYLLCRVSSKDQEDNYSLKAQEDRLIDYCDRMELQIVNVYKIVESSTRGGRPKFTEMLNAIKKEKEPIALVCDKVDRLQRSFKEVPILEQLRKDGKIELHFRSDNKVLGRNSSSTDVMHYNFLVMMAQQYAEAISENVIRSHERMIKEGKIFSQPVVGYKRNPENKKDVVVDDERAFLVRKLFVEYSTGLYSYDEMTDKAKEWGLTNPKSHKPYCRAKIAEILSDEFYIGIATLNRNDKKKKNFKYPHIYPHIISDELFKQCQDVREGRHTNHSNKSKDMKHNLFKGMIKCKNCNCTITPEIKKGKYVYLRPKPKNGCNCKTINEEVANKLVESVFKAMSIPEDVLQGYITRLEQRFNVQQCNENMQQKLKQQELNTLRKRLDRLVDVYLDNSIDKETYERKKTDLSGDIRLLESQISNFNNNSEKVNISIKYLLEVVSRINELYKSSEIDRKRKILKLVFPNFWLDGSNLSYDIKKTFEVFFKGACCLLNWAGVDSNHRSLATADLQSAPFSHSGTYPYLIINKFAFDGI